MNDSAADGAGSLLQASLGVNSKSDGSDNVCDTQARSTTAREVDAESLHYGQQVLQDTAAIPWDATLRSRVLKDPFHVFNMLRLSATHSLRKEFARALHDVLFVPDQEDCHHIITWLSTAKPPRTFEQVQAANPSWLWKHCRRIIPPPEILSPLINNFFLVYGPPKDAVTGLPLFNESHWKTAKQIREIIRQGLVSDPPGIPLYIKIGTDAKAGGLAI